MRKKIFIILSLMLLSLALVSCTSNYLAGLDNRNAVDQLAQSDPQMALDVAQQDAENGDVQSAVQNTTQAVALTLDASDTADVSDVLDSVNPTEVGSALDVIATTDVSTQASQDLSAAQEVLSTAAATITKAATMLQQKLLSGEATISDEAREHLQNAAKTTVKAINTKHGFTMDKIAANLSSLAPKTITKDSSSSTSSVVADVTGVIASLINTLPTNGEVELMIAMQKLARAANATPEATNGTFTDPMMAVILSTNEIVHIFYQLIDTNQNGYLDSGDDIYAPYQKFLASSKTNDDLQTFVDDIENLPNPFKDDTQRFNKVKSDLYDILYNLKIGVDALSTLSPDIDADSLKSDIDDAKSKLDDFFSSGFDVTSYDTVGDLIDAIGDQF